MTCRRTLGLLAALLTSPIGCERAKRAPAAESSAARLPSAVDSTARRRGGTWDPSAGPVLLVAGDTPAQAVVVPPDSATAGATLDALPRPASVTLLGRDGTVQAAELQPPRDSFVCRPWKLTAAPPPHSWSVGFVGGVVAPQPMDSIESLDRSDSTTLGAAITRLASAIPNDPAGRFAGLPFSMRAIWRFSISSGKQVAVGSLMRQINQEATPLQERTLVVAERDSGSAGGDFSLAYQERSYGDEESVETSEVLLAALIGPTRRPTLVIAHDFGDAVAYSVVDRDTGRWRVRWRSDRQSCNASGGGIGTASPSARRP